MIAPKTEINILVLMDFIDSSLSIRTIPAMHFIAYVSVYIKGRAMTCE